MMNNQRPVRLPLQLIIFAQRQDPQNASPVQGQQPTYGLRRNGGVVIDKYPSEATAEATAVTSLNCGTTVSIASCRRRMA